MYWLRLCFWTFPPMKSQRNLVSRQPTMHCGRNGSPWSSSWLVDCLSGGMVLYSDLSHERGPASATATVSNSSTTVRECRILAFAEFKEASFQLEASEIPFQPLEWPRGLRQYNDAWHNSASVLQPVPRKPHNMCHCAPCFAAQPRCLALAWDTARPGRTVRLRAACLVRQVQRTATWRPGLILIYLKLMCWNNISTKATF